MEDIVHYQWIKEMILMPIMHNNQNNISLEINLLNNSFLDIDLLRKDFENWVPFEFVLDVSGKRYTYSQEKGATFSLYELENFVSNCENVIKEKSSDLEVVRYEFCSSECYFDIAISDPLEEDLLSIEIWINIGSLTGGELFGYDKGFRFDVDLIQFKQFTTSISEQLKNLTAK
jgi:hypothetical protein